MANRPGPLKYRKPGEVYDQGMIEDTGTDALICTFTTKGDAQKHGPGMAAYREMLEIIAAFQKAGASSDGAHFWEDYDQAGIRAAALKKRLRRRS